MGVLCPKEALASFITVSYLDTNLRNCFLTECLLRMYSMMSVTSVFRADFDIEEREGEGIVTGVLQVWKPGSVVVHEMENHLGLFQSSRYNCLKSGIFILL